MTAPTPTPSHQEEPRAMRRIAIAGVAATTAEWLDFYVYTTAAALVLGPLFFPAQNAAIGTIAAFGTLAVGFLARPIGGIVAGHLGDRWGRRPTLVLAMVVMGAATTLIGVLPTYASAGVIAPVLLVLLRLIQGLAVGAQWAGGALLLTEHAPVRRRGFYGSLSQLGPCLGAALANGIFLLLSALLSDENFRSWGWRLPFLGGFVVVLFGMYVQRRIEESPVFLHLQAASRAKPAAVRPPLVEVFRSHSKAVVQAAGSFLVGSAAYYALTTGMVDYASRVVGLPRSTVLALVMGAGFVQVITLPLFGLLSDHIGRKKLFLAGTAAMAIWVFPVFLLADTGNKWLLGLGLVIAYVIHSSMYGPLAAMFVEMFPAEVRFSGASLGYQIASVVAGGFAPTIMAALVLATGQSWPVAAYLAVLAVISFVTVRTISEAFRRDLFASGSPKQPVDVAPQGIPNE
ncbi:MFS transporter [Kibdelosporangium aridum]|uniref:Predicted arabinose efflux permease, MFS family n=1 Tax=Kibdelosporangium aridum TaxID=2030 RepID=A0A1Y5Y2G4_KIBAR|nr:MFS transporter [Kibdelosporangium aridum]SMD22923.1 Predicted arabinose efflux permease, MFS family [Kibdelosporangium aridum]